MKSCPQCGNPVERKSLTFCSRRCASTFRTKDRNLIPKESLVTDYSSGMTWLEISHKYRVSLATVKRYLEKYEIQYKTDFDFSGQKIGQLTVQSRSYIKNTKQYWKCQCECGSEYHATSGVLLRSKTISCKSCRGINRREDVVVKTTLWNHYINGAKLRKIEFSITREYAEALFLAQHKKCALSGVDIDFSPSQGRKMRSTTTASLDRIDSSKGYIEGNVQWVHKRVNKLKMNMPENELFQWCNLISSHRG